MGPYFQVVLYDDRKTDGQTAAWEGSVQEGGGVGGREKTGSTLDSFSMLGLRITTNLLKALNP